MTEAAPKWEFAATGLRIANDIDFEEWSQCWNVVRGIQRSHLWHLGDCYRYGFNRWPAEHAQLLDQYAAGTGEVAKWVCDKIPIERRRESLSFSLHKEVARLTPEQQDEILDLAEKEKLSSREVKALVDQRYPDETRKNRSQPQWKWPSNQPPIAANEGSEDEEPSSARNPEPAAPEPAAPEPSAQPVERVGLVKGPRHDEQAILSSRIAQGPPADAIRGLISRVRAAAFLEEPSAKIASEELSFQLARVLEMELPACQLPFAAISESALSMIPPTWEITCSTPAGPRDWEIILHREPEKKAYGLGPSLSCALIEAALSAKLIDMGDEE